MALEDLLERIAVALEKSAALQEEHLNFVVHTQQTGTISQTLTHDLAERKAHMLRQAEEIMAAEKQKAEANSEPVEKAEVKEKAEPKAKPEKEKPKYDFNKEIRQPFVELLNTTKNKRGPKDATQLAKKLLKEFTGQIEEPLTVKTLPEAKYEDFLAEVKKQRSYVLDDEIYTGFDKD